MIIAGPQLSLTVTVDNLFHDVDIQSRELEPLLYVRLIDVNRIGKSRPCGTVG